MVKTTVHYCTSVWVMVTTVVQYCTCMRVMVMTIVPYRISIRIKTSYTTNPLVVKGEKEFGEEDKEVQN